HRADLARSSWQTPCCLPAVRCRVYQFTDDSRMLRMPKLSVVVPAYNEERSLVRCIERVLAIEDADLELEIIIVDDASQDGTRQLAEDLAARYRQVRVLRHAINQGKGAAL